MVAVRVIVVVALAACSSKGQPAPDPMPAPVVLDATPAPKPVDACADIRARFTAMYATRTDTCTTAADCGCYNPVGGPEMGCGGVTDATTVAKLGAIQQEFHAAGCQFTHDCAAWQCDPKCTAGRCSR
jgi:hypothetical protein